MKKLLLFAVAIIGFSAVSFGQLSANANATAEIKAALSIVKTPLSVLSFGYIIPGGGGTVTVPPVGARTSTSTGSDLLYLPGGTVSAVEFTIKGTGGSHFAVTLPGNISVLPEAPSTGAPMAVTDFTSDVTGASVTNVSQTSSLGDTETSRVFHVGATLTVASGQASGVYKSVDFPVTVNYN